MAAKTVSLFGWTLDTMTIWNAVQETAAEIAFALDPTEAHPRVPGKYPRQSRLLAILYELSSLIPARDVAGWLASHPIDDTNQMVHIPFGIADGAGWRTCHRHESTIRDFNRGKPSPV